MLSPDALVLCAGTLAGRGVIELCDAAQAGGFDAITLWPQTVAISRAAGFDLGEQRRYVDDCGLRVTEVDPLLTWLPGEPVPPAIAEPESVYYALADRFGARALNLAQGFGAEIDVDRAAEALAAVCDRAAERGLQVTLEFLPWSGIANLGIALDVVQRTGRANAAVMLDTWHHFRSGGDVEALRALPAAAIGGLQINDAPREAPSDLVRETMEARLLPGDGDIPLGDWLPAIADSGSDVAPGVEVFSRTLAAFSAKEIGRRCGAAARRVLASL